MTSLAMCPIAFKSHLGREGPHGVASLFALDRAQPGPNHLEDFLNRRDAFHDPFEVIGLAVRLDSANAEDSMQPAEHRGRAPDLTVLAGRCADPVPGLTANSRPGADEAEITLGIEESRRPRTIEPSTRTRVTRAGRSRQRDGGLAATRS